MFTLQALSLPVIAAPMAGGPSTPRLAAAVGDAGGLGFLAAGYKSPGAVADETAQLRSITGRPFGINLFVPDFANTYPAADSATQDRAVKLAAALAFRNRLATDTDARTAGTDPRAADTIRLATDTDPHGADPRTEPGFPNPDDDDGWAAKLDLVLHHRVPVVSFTFGLPEKSVFAALAGRGICTNVTVTDADEARAAADAGAAMLCVQGPEAGGHRGTLDSAKIPGTLPLGELLDSVREACDLPLIAAGGISTAADAAAARAAGAAAVQVGTALLLSSEAGTAHVHRTALQEAAAGLRSRDTALTRAFSGRPARGLVNGFMQTYPDAPDAYPYINQVTGPLRAAAAAAGDPEGVSLWAGTGYRAAVAEPAARIVFRLAGR